MAENGEWYAGDGSWDINKCGDKSQDLIAEYAPENDKVQSLVKELGKKKNNAIHNLHNNDDPKQQARHLAKAMAYYDAECIVKKYMLDVKE